jgi:hypothetical protein
VQFSNFVEIGIGEVLKFLTKKTLVVISFDIYSKRLKIVVL